MKQEIFPLQKLYIFITLSLLDLQEYRIKITKYIKS